MATLVEPLEQRLALTTISLNGPGDLVIESFGFANDELSIHADGPNNQFVISDPGQILNTGISGATGSGTNQVFLPFSSVANAKQLIVNTFDGDDVIRLTASNGFVVNLAPVLDGGDGFDAIELNAAVSVPIDDVNVTVFSEDIRLGGDITTAGGKITFQGNVFVTHDVELLTDGATEDGDVEFFGQVESSAGPSAYTLVTAPLSYEQARMQAGRDVPGGHLATIRSAAEQADVQALVGTNSVWLGASDTEVEGKWIWDSGPDFGVQFWDGDGTTGGAVEGEFSNWLSGEPDNIDGTAEGDSAFLDGSDLQGRWRDGDVTVARPYIVEAPSLFALTISAGGALVKLQGRVGNLLPLRSLTLNAGQTELSGGSVRTAEAQTFNSTVSLMGPTQLVAGEVDFGGGANSVFGSSGLMLAPIKAAAPITVGATTDAGPASFDITDTDIAALTSGLVKVAIGESSPAGTEVPGFQSRSLGPVTVTSATFASAVSISGGSISVTGLEVVGTHSVELTAVIGTITDGGGGAADVTANELLMDSAEGIGTSSNPLDLVVGAVAARTVNGGGVFLANTGNLVIGPTFAPGGIMANNDTVAVSSTGSITVNRMIFSAGGDVSLTAAEGITINGVPVDTAGGLFFADADSNNDGSGTFTLGSITEFVDWTSPTQGTFPDGTTVDFATTSLATATAQVGVSDTRFSDGNIYSPSQAAGEFVETRFEGQGEAVVFTFLKPQFGLFLHFDGMQYEGTPFDPATDNPINLYSFNLPVSKVSGESTWEVDANTSSIRQLSGDHLADQDGTVRFDGGVNSLTLFRNADGVGPGNESLVQVQLGVFRAGVLMTAGEAITIRAADMIVDGMIDANSGLVTLIPSGANRTVDLGSEEGSGQFVLTRQELDRISTTNGLEVGDTATGKITINESITRMAATNFTLTVADGQDIVFSGPNAMLNTNGGSVTLTTGGTGAILSGGAVDDLRASSVSLNAGSGGIGESGNPLALNADTLTTVTSGNGDQFLREVSDLTIDTSGLNAGSGVITLENGAFRLGGPNRIGDATTLSIGPSAALQLNGFGETLGGLSDSGSVFNGSTTAGGLTINGSGDSEFFGSLGGVGTNDNNFSLTKSGIGTFTLSGVSTFLGTTTVNGGTLILNGSTTSATTVAAEATLSGSGTINGSVTVNNGGTIAPGNSPGILNTGNLAFSGGSAGALPVSSYVTEAAGTGATVNADTGGVELTDGLFVTSGTFAFNDAAYVNYRDDNPDDGLGQPKVVFDLGDTFALSTVSIRYLHSTGAGQQAAGTITAPEQALVSVSKDGTTFSTPVAFTSQFNSSAGNAIRTAVLDLTGMTGRFVRVDIRQSQQHTFIDEISFTGGPPPPVFAAEVNGAIPGTGHDQLNVTGTVNLGGAMLSASGSITSSPGQLIVLINNDGTDAISGTFASLAEGATVTINGVSFVLSYRGGTGNDVTLTEAGALTFQGTRFDDAIELREETISGSDYLQLMLGGTLVEQRLTSSVTGAMISGGDGNDALTVNYGGSGGFFNKPVTFHGQNPIGGSGDSLVLSGGSFTTVTHVFTNASDGSVEINGSMAVSYTGLEPITDNLSATNRVFNFGGSSETITLTDAAGSAMTIDSPNSESVTFANPSDSLTINAGAGSDTVQISSVDANFRAALTINGETGTDIATLDTDLTLGVGAFVGSVLITAETINLNANISTDLGTNAGSIGLNGAVQLGANVTLDSNSTNGSDANITLSGTTNGARNLTTDSGGAATTFSGAIGATSALTDLDVTAGTIHLNANVTTDGGSLTFAGNTVLQVDVIIDTEVGNDNSAGSVAFSGGSLSVFNVTGTNRNLTINTISEAGNDGGSVTLAAINNAAGHSIRQLSISTLPLSGGMAGDITFTNAVTLASNGGLFVEGRTISLSTSNSDLTLSGSGSAFLSATRNIHLTAGSSIQAVDGDVSLEANQYSTPTNGNFTSIQLDQATIRTTGNGSVGLFGLSGDAGNLQYGILLQNSSLLEATGAGEIELGGESRGTSGPENDGILIASSSDILSNSGQIILRGIRGVGGTSEGIGVTNSGVTISATNAPVSLLADVIHIGETQPVISAGLGNVIVLRPLTPGTAIGLGAASSSDFSLSDAQLDRLTADVIEIGDPDSGTITISGNITRPSATSISLVTGGNNSIVFSGPNATLDSNNGEVTLSLNPAGTGAITSGGALKDVRGIDVSLTSGSGGIGTDANPLITDASTLFVETNGNADAFLSEIDSLTISSDGLSVDSGRIVFASGLFRLGGAGRLDDDSSLLIKSGAVFQLNGFNETVAAIAGGGSIINGTPLTVNLSVNVASGATSTFAGVLGGATANDKNFGLTSLGLGTLVLSGNNTFTGPLNVNAGKLLVNGSVTASANVASSAVLGGIGSLGGLNVNAGGTVAPGTSPGILNANDLSLQSNSNFDVELNGTRPGDGHDQINVTGTVTVNGLLNVTRGFVPTAGDTFVILRNDGSDAVSGNFSGLPQGSVLTIGGASFHIVYDFNSGDGNANDVALIVNRPPLIFAQNFDIAEDAIAGTVIGAVVANDADSAVTFAITAGDPAGTFAINGNTGQLTLGDPTGIAGLNQFVLTVEVTDDVGATKSTFITIDVLGPAPGTPSDADGNNNNRNDGFAPEGAIPGTRVGITLSAVDLQGDAIFYRLTDDADGRFTVDPLTGVVTVKKSHLLNFADATEHTIRGQAVDANGNASPEVTFVIDVVEVPVNALPLASILPSRVTIVEGDPDDPGHRFISFLVKLNKPSTETVQIDFSTRVGDEPGFNRPDGIPVDASFATDIVGPWDFFRSSGRLVFDPGVTEQTVRVQLQPDDRVEPNELFFVQLTSPVNVLLAAGQSVAVAEILDDDSVPQVVVENAQVLEGAAPGQKELVFRLKLVGDFASGLTSATVDFATDDLPIDTAISDVDYTSVTGTLTFTEDGREQEVRVPITGDLVDETDETLSLRFTNAIGLGLSRNFAVGTIINDDSADVVVSITPSVSKVREGQDGTRQVELFVTLIGQPTTDITVNYTTEDHQAIAGSDYVAAFGSVTFTLEDIAAGLSQKSIFVTINGDTDIELDEGFAVSLSLPTPLPDVSLDPSNSLARVVLRNDDQAILTEDADELFADLLTDLVSILNAGGGAKDNPALVSEMERRAVQIAQSLGLTRAIILIIDPVDFVLTDPGDRQSGYTEDTGSVNQIPGTYYSGDGTVELLIVPLPSDGTYNVQLAGLGGDFNASVTIVDGDRTISGAVSDFTGQFFQAGDLAVQFGEGQIPIGLGLAAANSGAAVSAIGVVGDFGHAEFRLALASALEQVRSEGLNLDDVDSRATGLMFWLSVSARVLRQRFIEPLWQSLGSPLDGLLGETGFTRITIPSELVDQFWSQVGQTLTGVPSGIYRLGNMLESVIPTLVPRRVRSAPPRSGDQGQPNSVPGNNGVKMRRSSLERPRVAPPNGQGQPPSKPNATKDKSAQTPDSKKTDRQQSNASQTRWLWFTFKDEKSNKPTERRGV